MGLLRLKSGPFHRFGSRYGSLFDSEHFLGRNALDDSWLTNPPADVKKMDEEIVVELALPGFKREDIKLEIDQDELHVTAIRSSDDTYQVEEIPKHISQYFQLSSTMDVDHITSELKDGVLVLKIPCCSNPEKTRHTISVS